MKNGTMMLSILLASTKCSLSPLMNRFASRGKTIAVLKSPMMATLGARPLP